MKRIITNIERLTGNISEPLEFITDTGITKDEGEEIVKQLTEILEKKPKVFAIAAPQIGINKRIFCIKFNDTIKTFINPIIKRKKGNTLLVETFSSMPKKEILIARPEEIEVVYYTDKFEYEDNKLLGSAAAIFDQQYQLLDGITPNLMGLVSDVEVDGPLSEVPADEMDKIINFYKDEYIPKINAAFQKSIEQDSEEAKAYKMLKFTEDVINGRTIISESEGEVLARQQAKKTANKAILMSMKNAKDQQKAQYRANLNTFLNKK